MKGKNQLQATSVYMSSTFITGPSINIVNECPSITQQIESTLTPFKTPSLLSQGVGEYQIFLAFQLQDQQMKNFPSFDFSFIKASSFTFSFISSLSYPCIPLPPNNPVYSTKWPITQNIKINPKKKNPNIFSSVIQDSCSKGVVI